MGQRLNISSRNREFSRYEKQFRQFETMEGMGIFFTEYCPFKGRYKRQHLDNIFAFRMETCKLLLKKKNPLRTCKSS